MLYVKQQLFFFQNLRTELKIRFCSKVINVQKNVFWVKIDILTFFF